MSNAQEGVFGRMLASNKSSTLFSQTRKNKLIITGATWEVSLKQPLNVYESEGETLTIML